VDNWNKRTKVADLKNFKNTEFVTTLESPISLNKNIIYCPSFLYAWGQVQYKLKNKILISDFNSQDFKLIQSSKSYLNSLNEEDIDIKVDIIDSAIIAYSFFNKTLPFDLKLHKFNNPIIFDKSKVSAFGLQYYDEDIIKFFSILYYENDTNFILKIKPKDKQNEIILVKGQYENLSLSELLTQTNKLISIGEKTRLQTTESWKYQILEDDTIAIPVIKFNIETSYDQLKGQIFYTSDNKRHIIEEAYQRIGFILNENGAVVESEAVAMTDSLGFKPEIQHLKRMIFNKPFFIIIKQVDKINPYFVMKVNNDELMIKE
jgi:hypothetical protein